MEWYNDRFKVEVSWNDDSWAWLEFENISLALVLPSQPPPHIAFIAQDLERFGKPKSHQDGTASVYLKDNQKNVIEMLSVPNVAGR